MDEMMDFGYPQSTDGKILQEYVSPRRAILRTQTPLTPVTLSETSHRKVTSSKPNARS